MAQHLVASGYEIAPVLRSLFRSRAFYGPDVMHAQIKSPVEFVVAAVRHLGVADPDWSRLAMLTANAGQRLFFPPTVKGWDGGKAWINAATVFTRASLVGALLSGRFGTPDLAPLFSLEALEAHLLHRRLPPARREILAQAITGPGREAVIHLAMSLPEYQVS
jgi:hypothetical protein